MNMLWGAPDEGAPPPPTQTVALMLERLKNATFAGDRRDIINDLKEMAPDHQAELGAAGLPVLLSVLRNDDDRQDEETTEGVLRIFTDIVTRSDEEKRSGVDGPGIANTEVLLRDASNVELFLDLLQDRALWVRLITIKLLTELLYNRPAMMEATVLSCSAGMLRLTDVLQDSREEIRYELLLLLLKLTETNAEVQKSVAFQDGFDKLFRIMDREGVEDAGIIIRDCLQIILNMLSGNQLTCKLFMQGSSMRHLVHILTVLPNPAAAGGSSAAGGGGDDGLASPPRGAAAWTADRQACLQLALNILAAVSNVPMPPRFAGPSAPSPSPSPLPPGAGAGAGAGYGGARAASAASGVSGVSASSGPPSGSSAASGLPAPPVLRASEALLRVLVQLGTTSPHIDTESRQLALCILQGLLRRHDHNQATMQMLCCTAPAGSAGAVGADGAAASTTADGTSLAPALSLLVLHSLFCGGESDAESAAAYGAVDAFLDGNPAGPLGMVSHVRTPPPASALGLPDSAVPPAPPGQHVVSTFVRSAPSALLHSHDDHLLCLFRACRLLQAMLRGDTTAKEVALHISAGPSGTSLFDTLCVHVATALGDAGPRAALPKAALTALLVEWLTDCQAAVDTFFAKPANLFVFDVAAGPAGGGSGAGAGAAGAVDRRAGATPPPVATASPLADRAPRCLAALIIAALLRHCKPDPQPDASGTDAAAASGRAPTPDNGITQSTVLRMVTSRVTVAGLGRLLDDLAMSMSPSALKAAAAAEPMATADYRLLFTPQWGAAVAALHDECKQLIVKLYTTPTSGESDALRREVLELQSEVATARDARDAAVAELDELKDEHGDLLVLLAEHDFSIMALRAALLQSAGKEVLQAALDEAQRQLEDFCSGKGLEDDGMDASSCSPGS